MPGLRVLLLALCDPFSGPPLRHTSFGSRWGLLSASINRWVLANGVHTQDDLQPRRLQPGYVAISHVSAVQTGELLGQALIEQRAVGGELAV